MCGIVGILDASATGPDLRATIGRMVGSLRHRGPDDGGVWLDDAGHVALGHRRLSVIDLSPSGHQPMRSSCGRYSLVFNGEIYNFREIRGDCERAGGGRAAWRGHSDTEVALEAIATWGLRRALDRFNGMFALALWDRESSTLHLARDRVGEKPLYYGWSGGHFLFASELRAIRAHPGPEPEIDRDALAELLANGYVSAPRSILRGFSKLPPGCFLTLASSAAPGQAPRVESFWSIGDAFRAATAAPFRGTAEDAVEQLDALLHDAVRLRMVSDVPLGAFLSGGVDSSAVVALMQAQSDRPVETFCVGFRDRAYDEAPYAEAVARHLGTRHHTMYVTADDALAVVPHLGSICDEPFGDSSQIPTWLLASLTRRHVTVALSGDGGDELFAGYTRYAASERLWKTMSRMPHSARRVASSISAGIPVNLLDRAFTAIGPVLNRYSRPGMIGDKLKKVGSLVTASSPDDLYEAVLNTWAGAAPPVLRTSSDSDRDAVDPWWRGAHPSFLRRMMLRDLSTYLPDDILTKVDRTTMNVALEGRIPLLDHRVVEFALRLPVELCRHDGVGKWPLRRVLHKYVPAALMDRPKRGFGVPLADWLRGPLRPWAEDLLDEDRLRRDGYLDPHPVVSRWREHISGTRNWQHSLWNILMFQSWLTAPTQTVVAREPVRC